MEPELKQILENTQQLVEENNKILRKVRRFQKIETFWRILKIIIIVGVAFGMFYFLEPYINKLTGLYSSISGTGQNTNNNPFQDLFKRF